MAGTYTAIDLSQLPPPQVVEVIDYETILQEGLADFYARMAESGTEFTALVESDPLYKLAQTFAFREMLVRQRANESALAVMLAYAQKSDLDQIGANFNLPRNVLIPADPTTTPPTPAVMESDEAYRARIQLVNESYTTAGSEGSYVFHALSADAKVKDVQPVSPVPGQVLVYVLSRDGNGTADTALLGKVNAALNKEEIRPLTDNVVVQSASIIEYTVTAELVLYPCPDSNVILQAAKDELQKYVDAMHRVGFDVTISGIYQALHRPGVQTVNLTTPTQTIVVNDGQAAYCTAINVTIAGGTDV
ncbi:baseplate protein [Acinetobacter phage vB_AbaP_Alexa]|nr:baseplate protein [Acinetobacter phage vB_AbaP_Alexa]